MNRIRMTALVALAASFLGTVEAPARAADAPLPQVTAGGSGEVHIPPTRASFAVSIETTAATSAAAAAENARITKDVTTALYAAGLARDELKSSHLNVNAVWDFAKGERHRRGYTATNTLQVDTKQLEKLGVFIDTGLEAGASAVSGPSFAADDRSAARRQALALAVTAAREDAETIAKASGGALGELLDAGTDGAVYSGAPMPMMAMSRAAGASTEVVTSEITVSAHVNMRWAFVPARH
jgi:uncharacterized protein